MGQVAFRGTLTSTSGGTTDDIGIFRTDGTRLTQIVRTGQAAPDGNGSFDYLNDPVQSNAGRVAFIGGLDGTSGDYADNFGVFLYDDRLGLVRVIRGGDPLFGSTLSALNFVGRRNLEMSELGHVAFKFHLYDGRQGIAVAKLVPEPPSLMLHFLTTSMFLLHRARCRVSTALSFGRSAKEYVK